MRALVNLFCCFAGGSWLAVAWGAAPNVVTYASTAAALIVTGMYLGSKGN